MRQTVNQKIERARNRRSPFDHLRIKDSLIMCKGKVRPVDALIASLGIVDYHYEIIEEVPLNNCRFMDSIALVKGTDAKTGEPCSFSIGFELKKQVSDLEKDNKIPNYLGYTDYFFIAVSNNRRMLPLLERYNDEPRIGAIMFRKDWLIKTAQRQVVLPKNQLLEDQILLGRLNRHFRQQYVEEMLEERRAGKQS